jgi:hypothetical protein
MSEILDKLDKAKNKMAPLLATGAYYCLAVSISLEVISP